MLILNFLFALNLFGNLSEQPNNYSLEQCIDYALKHSTDINRSENSLKSEKSNLEQSKAAQGPNLLFNVNQNVNSSNNYTTTESNGCWDRDNYSSTNLILSSSITLYNGAKLKNSIRQDKINLAAAESDIQTEKELLSLNIVTAYINVLLSKEQLMNSQSQLQSTEKQLEYAKARKSAGIISNVDYLNIKSQYATDKAALISAQSNLKINLVSLMQLMNMPVNDLFDIVEPNITAEVNNLRTPKADKIYNTALGIRPEIKTAELDFNSALTGIKIAKADALPSLLLNGSLGTSYMSNLSGICFSNQLTHQVNPSVGLSLSVPIYQRKQVKNQIEQATILADNYQLILTDTKNNLRKAIEQACTDVSIANMTYQASQEQYQAEQNSYQLSEEMFSQGLINSVDYLTSKNNLIAAESSLTQAKFNVVLQNKIIDYYCGEPIIF